MKKNLCYNRHQTESGILYLILREMQARENFCLQLIVTGMHLSPEFGLTYKFIENDGFKINKNKYFRATFCYTKCQFGINNLLKLRDVTSRSIIVPCTSEFDAVLMV